MNIADDFPGSAAARPDATTRTTRALAIALLVALVALGIGWELWWAPTGSGLLALKVAPLLLALGGLARLRLTTARKVALLVWIYVLEGLVRATSEAGPSAWLAAGEVVLAVALFGACSWHIRHRLALGRRRAAAAATATPTATATPHAADSAPG